MEESPDNPRLKQPYFIHSIDRQPLFFTALGATDPEGAASFVIITSASHDGLADIHDRRPLALTAAAARDWIDYEKNLANISSLLFIPILANATFLWL
ncbi:hypothetical protein SME06J_48960 (plasmid) [Serratia marcescens]|nr:hypothetical protein SME06J_48960 [Serratia marcescens]